MRIRLVCTVVGVLLAGTAANAQFLPRQGAGSSGAGAAPGGAPAVGGIGSAPSAGGFSPYLNLARGGSAAVNYYGIVRPQINFQNSIQTLQQQQQQGSANTADPYDPTLPFMVVGTRARFLNTGGYFLNLNGSAGGAGMGPTGRSAGAGQSGAGGGVSSAVGTGMGTILGGSSLQSGSGVNRGSRR